MNSNSSEVSVSENAIQPNISLKIVMPLLAAIMAISPLAVDLYLPAMSQIAKSFSVDIPVVQNTLSIYLFGYAIGLILFGPLADKLSRRRLVIIGILGYMLASVGLIFCHTIEQFFAFRFMQALLSSAATVIVPGTIRELYKENTAKGLSYVTMIMMLAPLVAPTLGSALLLLGSWRMIFIVIAAYALLVLVLALFILPERSQTFSKTQFSFIQRYQIVLGNQKARLDLISSMMVSLAFFAYLTAIPFVYLTVFSVSEVLFSGLFALNVLALMSAHFINTRLVTRKGSRVMLHAGIWVAVVSSLALVLVNYLSLSLWATVICIFPLMGSISMIAVNADAVVLTEFAEHSGTATAVIGTLRFGVGALAGPFLAFFYNGTAMPFALLMLVSILVVAFCQWKISIAHSLNKAI